MSEYRPGMFGPEFAPTKTPEFSEKERKFLDSRDYRYGLLTGVSLRNFFPRFLSKPLYTDWDPQIQEQLSSETSIRSRVAFEIPKNWQMQGEGRSLKEQQNMVQRRDARIKKESGLGLQVIMGNAADYVELYFDRVKRIMNKKGWEDFYSTRRLTRTATVIGGQSVVVVQNYPMRRVPQLVVIDFVGKGRGKEGVIGDPRSVIFPLILPESYQSEKNPTTGSGPMGGGMPGMGGMDY